MLEPETRAEGDHGWARLEEQPRRTVFRGVGQRPVLAVLVGAVAIAFSGILFRLSHVSASTGAFYRCVFAFRRCGSARLEDHRYGPRTPRRLARLAGRRVFRR